MPPQETSAVEMNKVSDGGVKYKDDNSSVDSPGCCKRCTNKIILSLENFFASLGCVVSKHPIRVIVIALVCSLLCMIGVVDYRDETRQEKLWVASDSKSLEHSEWVGDRYPPQSRIVTVIGEMSNVLSVQGMAAACEVDRLVKDVKKNDTDLQWSRICLSLDKAGKFCSPSTILVLWGNNCTLIKSLTQQQILERVNDKNALKTPSGNEINLILLLGDISRDGNNNITGAKATKMTYFLKNQEVESTGKRVDEKGEAWEEEFEAVFSRTNAGFSKVWTYSRKGQREDSGSAISEDLQYLFIGYILIILYLAVVLGSFSRINQKVWLALCGVLNIGVAIGIAYGLSSAFQLFATPVHSILPFLLLGIGVDDVFVVIQNWDNIGGSTNKERSIQDNVSRTVRTAGVSILVTSFTDVCAFLIGATTILPALRSFCIFAGIGVLAVFILTCTFFIAWLSLDSKRQRGKRDACCCCIKLSDNYEPNRCSRRMYLKEFMKNTYSYALLSTPGRIIMMVVWAALLAVGAYGLSELKQDFDPNWFLPDGSKAKVYTEVNDKYFSTEGIDAYAYIGQINYYSQQAKLTELYNNIKNNEYNVKENTRSWYEGYKDWLQVAHSSDLNAQNLPKTSNDFYTFMEEFLESSVGRQFYSDIVYDNTTKTIRAMRMKYKHIKLNSASTEVKAMDSLQETVQKTKFAEGFEVFGYSRFYVGWETNKVISTELVRNLVLAGVIVFLVTLFLIADVWVSLMVVSCVVFTLINIAGYMHFWGLTIDTVTTIILILAIGLSVDYSAHIGHGFMASREGNRVERAANALEEIGPAVVHGGFSTFLAFICLSASSSYVFSTFFKVFFLVVVFGMFHGLVYLPIVLSLVGPKPYGRSTQPDDVKTQQNGGTAVELKEKSVVANSNADANGQQKKLIIEKLTVL